MFIGSPKDAAQLSDVARIIHVHIGVPEMQLKTVMKVRVFCAALNLGNGIRLKRIDTAKGPEPIGILRNLMCGPVVLSSYLSVFVCDRRPIWIAVLISQR
jgi:hypothetical protein